MSGGGRGRGRRVFLFFFFLRSNENENALLQSFLSIWWGERCLSHRDWPRSPGGSPAPSSSGSTLLLPRASRTAPWPRRCAGLEEEAREARGTRTIWRIMRPTGGGVLTCRPRRLLLLLLTRTKTASPRCSPSPSRAATSCLWTSSRPERSGTGEGTWSCYGERKILRFDFFSLSFCFLFALVCSP